MNYEAEEDAIIARLITKFTAFAVDNEIDPTKFNIVPLPEVDEDFDCAFGKRLLIVAFTGEQADPDLKSLTAVHQEGAAMFTILLKSKTLRGSGTMPGIYSLINLIKKYLVGFKTLGGEPLVYVDTKFEDKKPGAFEYAVTFKSKINIIQDIDEEEEDLGGLLTKVNYQ